MKHPIDDDCMLKAQLQSLANTGMHAVLIDAACATVGEHVRPVEATQDREPEKCKEQMVIII